MWKLFGKKEAVKDNKIDATKVFVDVDGKRVQLSTLMNSYDGIEVLQETDVVTIEGKEVSISELVTSYKNSKANEFPPKDKEEDPKEKKEDAKECSKCGKVHNGDCPKKNEEEVKKDSKENGKDFYVDLQNARHAPIVDGKAERGMADTREDKAARGKRFFGSKKK